MNNWSVDAIEKSLDFAPKANVEAQNESDEVNQFGSDYTKAALHYHCVTVPPLSPNFQVKLSNHLY